MSSERKAVSAAPEPPGKSIDPAPRAARTGRPIKPARKGKRARLSVDVSSTTKALIAKRAKESGRTLAREAEIMIERSATYDEFMARSQQTLEEMQKGNVEAMLWRLGYTPVRTPNADKPDRPWKLWAEPGYPGTERSEFVP